MIRILLLAEVSLDRKEIEQGADILLLGGADSLLDGILVQLFAGDAEPGRTDSLRPEGDVASATEGGRLTAPKRGLRDLLSK